MFSRSDSCYLPAGLILSQCLSQQESPTPHGPHYPKGRIHMEVGTNATPAAAVSIWELRSNLQVPEWGPHSVAPKHTLVKFPV